MSGTDHSSLRDDPFWSAVRRRHPDLDIVLAATEPAATEPAATEPAATEPAGTQLTLPLHVVRDIAGATVGAWRQVAPLLGSLAPDGPRPVPAVRWAERAGRHALLVEKSVPGLGAEGGTALLRRVTLRLGEQGWRLLPTRRADRPLLLASNGLVEVEAEAGAGATRVRFASGLIPVAEADRALVRAEVSEAVASWG